MRKSLIYNILGAFFMLIALSSCYDQDVEAPQSTDTYPIATFTTDFSGTEIMEGETIDYTITLDRMLDHDITFTVQATGDADDHDFSFEPVTIPAYTKTGQISVAFTADNLPEDGEALNLEFGIFDLATQYTINPQTVYPNLDLTVVNKNVAGGLTVSFEWDNHDDDWDLMIIDEAVTAEWSGWAGATGANPEITVLTDDQPDGVYYAELDPYSVDTEMINFTIRIGFADQTNQFFTAAFDDSLAGTYPTGSGYRFVKIVKSGSEYTCTLVPEFGS